jgi:hypothetical protein
MREGLLSPVTMSGADRDFLPDAGGDIVEE